MNIYVKYLIITGILMVLDVAWIAMNVSAYSSVILNVQKSPVRLRTDYAIIAYLFILFSVIYVAIPFTTQSIKKGDSIRSISIETKLLKSFMYGGAVGFSIYGIYNFTSLAIYKDLDSTIGIIDTLWGTALYTITTFVFLLLPD
uniref:DUF2177 family protein n=1 Tax=viral metagenome TaxID=1070528 RepID=A0A6C0LKS9_9ZZZZ